MRADKIVASLRRAKENDALHRMGEEVGTGLARRQTDELRELEHRLATLAESEDPFTKGYLAAVGDVLSAFLLAVGEEEDVEEVATELVKRRWVDVLRAIDDGHHRVTEIATALHTDKGTISNILDEMRAAGLVESFEDMGDKRSRPHRMTARGERVLRAVHDLPRAFEEGVTCAVHAVASLRDQESLSTDDLARELPCPVRDPTRVAAFVVEKAAQYGLAVRDGEQIRWDSGSPQWTTDLFEKLSSEVKRLTRTRVVVRAEGSLLDLITVATKMTPGLGDLVPTAALDVDDTPRGAPWVYLNRTVARRDEWRGLGRRQQRFIVVPAKDSLRLEPLDA